MLMREAREQIVEYGSRLISEHLTAGTAGNLSVFDAEHGWMAISPSGIPYDRTMPEDVVIMDLDGNVVEGDRKPSSEHSLHSVFYRIRPDARAVVHAHSMYCTTLACLGEPLRPVHYMIFDAGCGEIPVAPYRLFGTKELAEAVRDSIGPVSRGILLANHGMCACGESMKRAFGLALTMEWCAELQWRCMAAGRPNILSDEQMADVARRFASYGQTPSAADGGAAGGGGGYNG